MANTSNKSGRGRGKTPHSHASSAQLDQLHAKMRALEREKKSLESLFKYSSIGIVTVDKDFRIISCNPEFERIFQYKESELLGRNIDEVITDKDTFQEARKFSKKTYQGIPVSSNGKRFRKDGTEVFVDIFTSPIVVDGEFIGCYGLYVDITERVKMSQALKESETLTRDLIELSPLGIIAHDLEGKILFVNPAALKILGAKDLNEVLGRNALEFIHPDSYDDVLKRAEQYKMDLTFSKTEEKIITLKAETLTIESSCIKIPLKGMPAIMSVFSDISGRKKAGKKLQEQKERFRALYEESKRQEELYRSLLNSSADAIIIYNLQGEAEFVNPSFTKMFGWTLDEVKGKRIPFVPEEEKSPSMLVIMDLIENGTMVQGFETRRYTKDGKTLNISISASRYNDHTGKPAGMLVILRDITDRKLTEKKLIEEERKYRELYNEAKQQEEMYRSLLRSSADAIIIYNLEGEAEFVSPSFTRMFGWSFEEVEGKQIPFVPDNERGPTEAAIKKLFSTKKPITNFETKRLTKDGRLLNISVSGSLFDDAEGKPAGVLVFLRDITDRIRAEKAIHESEKRFRELHDSVSDLIYTQNLEGRFTSANKALFDIFGLRPEEFIGKFAADFMKPELRDAFFRDYLGKILKEGSHEGLVTYFTKDGRKIYLEHRSTLIKPEKGEPYISGIGRDVTERVLAEKRIKKLREEMLQAQKMEAIGTLAGGIAHDFNNLLMGIQGNISLLKLQTPENSPEYERLKSIEEHVQSGAKLTSQLLGFARGGRYQVKPTNMNRLIEKELNLFGRAKKELEIHKKFEKDIWSVEVDQGQMEQVLLNLFVNAWQAMPRGGHLFVQTKNSLMDEKTAESFSLPPGRYVTVMVTDTGIGMDAETRERIFEPFFSTKKKGHGTGLGLASTYGIIKNHGGAITVESAPHEGSTFTFFLPASEQPPREEEVKIEKLVRGKGHIMLIDDEEKILEVGKLLLEAMGYRVSTFSRGRDALGAFKKESGTFDLVILDMVMPEMGGREVFQKLRAINPDIKVLLASGYSIDGEASKIMAQGCNGFIQKPFSMEKLSNKIQEVIASA